MKLKRIEIVAAVENDLSQKVAERAGAYKEGIARNRLLIHKRFHDAAVYSFIEPIWYLYKEEYRMK